MTSAFGEGGWAASVRPACGHAIVRGRPTQASERRKRFCRMSLLGVRGHRPTYGGPITRLWYWMEPCQSIYLCSSQKPRRKPSRQQQGGFSFSRIKCTMYVTARMFQFPWSSWILGAKAMNTRRSVAYIRLPHGIRQGAERHVSETIVRSKLKIAQDKKAVSR